MTTSMSMTSFGMSATIYTTSSATNMMLRTTKVSILGSTLKFTENCERNTATRITLDRTNINASTNGGGNRIANLCTNPWVA
jgi:hypothetical protein